MKNLNRELIFLRTFALAVVGVMVIASIYSFIQIAIKGLELLM